MPHQRVTRIRDEFDRLISRIDPTGQEGGDERSRHEEWWQPRIDHIESEHEHLIHIDLPGVDKEDIELEAEGHLLHVHGIRREDRESDHRLSCRECKYGPFHRTFSLPSGTAVDDVEAFYEKGVLSIRIPKKTTATEARTITIT